MTIRQIEALLKESTFEYLRTGSNYDEVVYYAKLLIDAKGGKEVLQQSPTSD